MAPQPPSNPSKWSELKAKLVKKWQEVTTPSNKSTMTTPSDGVTDSLVYLCPSCQAPLPPELLSQKTVICESCGFEIIFPSPP